MKMLGAVNLKVEMNGDVLFHGRVEALYVTGLLGTIRMHVEDVIGRVMRAGEKEGKSERVITLRIIAEKVKAE